MAFTHNVVNHTFKVKKTDVVFTVTALVPWPAEDIKLGKKGQVMASAEEGELVCAQYGKAMIPVIRCQGGVVKLAEVLVAGKRLTKAGAIATALGLTEVYKAYKLKEL